MIAQWDIGNETSQMSQLFQLQRRWAASFAEGYMSEGEILLTNDRMENNIPYISLNSCKNTETFSSPSFPGILKSSDTYFVFRDPSLLLAVPFVVIKAAAVAVKDVQVVDGHLQTQTQVEGLTIGYSSRESRSTSCRLIHPFKWRIDLYFSPRL